MTEPQEPGLREAQGELKRDTPLEYRLGGEIFTQEQVDAAYDQIRNYFMNECLRERRERLDLEQKGRMTLMLLPILGIDELPQRARDGLNYCLELGCIKQEQVDYALEVYQARQRAIESGWTGPLSLDK